MVKSTAKKTKHLGKSLASAGRFKQPLLFIIIFLFIAAGSILIYASLASSIPVVGSNADFWRTRIGYCESGGRLTATNGSGHYGVYQFDVRTWRGAVGPELAAQYPNAAAAPQDVQDLAFNNTFARRGSQPWNASFNCWATDDLKAQRPSLSVRLPLLGSGTAPTPVPTPAKNAYNVKVNGRVSTDNKITPGVTLVTCVDGVIVKTDAAGVFRFELPAGKEYCVRAVDGLPAGAHFESNNNNVEHNREATYEHQLAAKNYYHNLWQFFTPYYTWDRDSDEGFDIRFTTAH